jgi:uncharacterized protein (TIGR02300 family)
VNRRLTKRCKGDVIMAKADLGTKRACLSCGMRFYDFKRSPILCPGCGTEFDPENIIKNRKSRSNSKAANGADTDAGDDDQIETDETDALAESIVVGNDDDDDIDFDDDEVNEDADGPGIIQDDISDDDELLPSLDDKDDG